MDPNYHPEKQLTIDGDEVPAYVNEACPEQCSTEHDVPDARELWDAPEWDGICECPETGARWAYQDATAIGGDARWYRTAWGYPFLLVDWSVRLVNPWDWGFEQCAVCGMWFDTEQGGGYCEYVDESRCERHYEHEPEDTYREDAERGDAHSYATCSHGCPLWTDSNKWLDLLTEDILCDAHAPEDNPRFVLVSEAGRPRRVAA